MVVQRTKLSNAFGFVISTVLLEGKYLEGGGFPADIFISIGNC